MKNSDFSSASIVEQTCKSAMQEKYSTMCKSLPSSQCYCVKQPIKLQNCSARNSYQYKYANYCRYSENEPLLHRERIWQYPSIIFFLQFIVNHQCFTSFKFAFWHSKFFALKNSIVHYSPASVCSDSNSIAWCSLLLFLFNVR